MTQTHYATSVNVLINKILFASSQNEVKKACSNALLLLEENNAPVASKAAFIEAVIAELEKFNPMNKDAQQWSNIHMARIELNRVKQSLPAGKAK